MNGFTRIYISGPITGMPDGNIKAFFDAAHKIRTKVAGAVTFNPYEKRLLESSSWQEHMRMDIKMLMDCDGVCMLPGWQHSRGANLEHRIAVDLGLVVRTLEEWLA